MAVIGIDYDGGGYIDYDDNGDGIGELIPLEYESVYLHTKDNKYKFSSGNFVVDWYNAIKQFFNETGEDYLSHSSSVNHFIMDGAPFDSAYAFQNPQNGMMELKYLDPNWADTIESMIIAKPIYEEGIEMFVEEGTTPTFEELKEYVKNK